MFLSWVQSVLTQSAKGFAIASLGNKKEEPKSYSRGYECRNPLMVKELELNFHIEQFKKELSEISGDLVCFQKTGEVKPGSPLFYLYLDSLSNSFLKKMGEKLSEKDLALTQSRRREMVIDSKLNTIQKLYEKAGIEQVKVFLKENLRGFERRFNELFNAVNKSGDELIKKLAGEKDEKKRRQLYKEESKKHDADLANGIKIASHIEGVRELLNEVEHTKELSDKNLTQYLKSAQAKAKAEKSKQESKTKLIGEWVESRRSELKKIYAVVDRFKTGKKLTVEEIELICPVIGSGVREKREILERNIKCLEDQVKALKGAKLHELSLDINKPKDTYPKNCMVTGTTGQRELGFDDLGNKLNYIETETSLPKAILKAQQQRSMIHDYVENGKPAGKRYQVPAISTRAIDCWNLNERRKRIVFYIEGYDHNEAIGKNGFEKLKLSIESRFGKKVEFHKLKEPSIKEVEGVFGSIAKAADKNTEVLIVLNGHGGTYGTESGLGETDSFKEGSMIGSFQLNRTESFLENMLKEQTRKLKHIKACLIIVNACHSGAWIADKEEKNIKNGIQIDYSI